MYLRDVLTVLLVLCSLPFSYAQERATSSVLASGTWRKVSVSESGMYHISASDLATMGFSDPSQVRVYGSGGKQLSFVVGEDLRDDLVLMPAVHTSAGITFYAEGPDTWTSNSDGSYTPSFNAYSKSAYYFLTTGSQSDDVTTTTAASSSSQVLTSYDAREVHALRTSNLETTGRDWVGEELSLSSPSLSLSLSLPSTIGEKVYARAKIATQLTSSSKTFTLAIDGATTVTKSLVTSSTYSAVTLSGSTTATSSEVSSVTLSCDFSLSSETIYLTYVGLSTTAPLTMSSSSSLTFRNYLQETSSGIVTYQITDCSSNIVVWDVTDATSITQLPTSLASDGTLSFSDSAGVQHEYIAFDTTASFPSPTDEGDVSNHNLHSNSSVNYLIVTTPTFASYAERLGSLHSSLQGLSYRVVYVDDIYEEFSAGRAEAPAIRNYIKMLYDRGLESDDELLYVLLLGSGSYDNYDRTNETNIIPTYQCATPYGLVASYATDDFYCWMDSGEGNSDTQSVVDIGLGRISITTTDEAEIAVSKIENYMSTPTPGNWQGQAVFIGSGGDSNEHVGYAEKQASNFEDENPDMNVVRIYSEAYTRTTTATGYAYPTAVSTFSNYLNSGCGLIHYTGHGGSGSTGDGYMTTSTVSSATNGGKLQVLVAATCTLAPYDQMHGSFTDGGMLNPDGGFIGVFAANRECYGSGNYSITRPFVKYLYSINDDGSRNTFGYAMKMAKIEGPKSINSLKYNLWGDPALIINCPIYPYAQIDSVNGVALSEATEAIKALELSTISGAVYNSDGTIDSDFNGTANVTLYDKRTSKSTSGVTSGTAFEYSEWSTKLYSGEVDVTDGLFSASFLLSKEFDLSVGYGRVEIYASSNDSIDAMGSTEQILVGGFSDEALTDTIGPTIEAWVDYERDDDGNILNSTLILYAVLEDEQGINISGQGIGHDITLTVDGDRDDAITLNDYFTYESGSYTKGMVVYPLYDIDESEHTLTIKAWDNLNNSNSVTFNVNMNTSVSNLTVDVSNIVVSGSLNMILTSNIRGTTISARTRLYTIGGLKVADNTESFSQSNGTTEIIVSPDARNLPTGIYILRCDLTSNAGSQGSFSKKIFIKAQ